MEEEKKEPWRKRLDNSGSTLLLDPCSLHRRSQSFTLTELSPLLHPQNPGFANHSEPTLPTCHLRHNSDYYLILELQELGTRYATNILLLWN
jgi:hypothetical protein